MRNCVRASILLCTLCSLVSLGRASPVASAVDRVLALDPTAGEIPESLTIDRDGNLYFSLASQGTINKLTPAGVRSTFGTLPLPVFALGVKVGADGCVYNVSTSLSPSPSGAFVWRICSPGVVEEYAALDPNGGPNDLAFDDRGNLFVTDPFLGEIFKVTPDGNATVWLADPRLQGNPAAPVLLFHEIGVDGIAFDDDKEHLYVGNLDEATILRIEVGCGGAPGRIETFVSDPAISGIDGIAFDSKGNLFAAINSQNHLVSIDSRGAIDLVSADPLLDSPSSVVFGDARNAKHTLYFTSSAFSRTFGLEAGTPEPAILETRVKFQGLRLP